METDRPLPSVVTRRQFGRQLASLAAGAVLVSSARSVRGARPGRRARLLVRSSWQTVNIGDIGHTPGMLALIERHLPEVEVRLWPSDVGDGVEEMLRRRFPRVGIVKGPDAIRAALAECDFLLHGSGPGFVAENDVRRWHSETGKPFGIGGISLRADAEPRTIELLSKAQFVFFRDSVSLAATKAAGCTAPRMEFGPDAAFAVDVRDDEAAQKFLHAHDLAEGTFLCCIPKLRHTPYWLIKPNRPFSETRHARNEAMKESDHRPLRDAIVAVVRQTLLKVLLVPEDMTHMAVGREMLLDPLPPDVKQRVVWRQRFWLTNEAVSTYVRSAGLFGNEMHSPIMCVGNGVPAVVCRWAEQSSKGFMWQDIGLGDWLFDHDRNEPAQRLVSAVLDIAQRPDHAQARAARARAVVQQRHAAMMRVLGECLGLRSV